MLQLRIREFTPDGVRGKKIITVKDTISVADLENGAASLSFAVSTATVGRFTHDEFVVGVEYALGGVFVALPRNDLFLVSANSGDDADTSKTVTFTGETYPYAMLPKHWVIGGANAKDGKLHFKRGGADTNAGDIAKTEFDESRGAGWAPQIRYTFTHLKDSNGVNWAVSDRQQISISIPVTQERLISALVDQGMCEIETKGTEIRLLRPGTTRDRANVVLGGPEFTRIPVKVNAKDRYTRLFVVMDGGKDPVFHVPVPGADTRFGTVDALITLSGVTDRATAQKIATQRALEGAAVQREESYEWTPTVKGFVPWRDFQVGDTVTARARGGKIPRRVIGLVVREQNGTVTARAVVGDHVASSTLKSLKKLSSVAVGGIVGGSGESFLHHPLPSVEPSTPVGLHVSAKESSWSDAGEAITTVSFEWATVTADIGGQEVTITQYELWSRIPSGQLTLETASEAPTATVEGWPAGQDRLVAVRAQSFQGVWSEFSLEVLVNPDVPTSVVPKAPGALTVASNVGAFTPAGTVATVTLGVPAVTESTDDTPITVAEYELWLDGVPVGRFPASPARFTVASGGLTEARVRASSLQGAWGDLSAELTVTGAVPTTPVCAPSTPILVSGYGQVSARWDGTYEAGDLNGAHTVWVEARLDADAWARQGPALTGPGSTLIRLGEVDETVAVRLVAYDQIGRETGVSEIATIVIAAIDGAALVVDSVDGNKLRAGTVFADSFEPNLSENLNLSANGSIVLMAGRMDDLSSDIATVTDDIAQIDAKATSANIAASAASAAAAIADGKALVAQVQAQDAADGLASQQAVFVVTPTGAEVRSKDASNIVQILPTGVAIVQGGVAVSSWDGARFITNELIANRAQLANHVIEKSGSRTVIRAL